MVRVGQHALDAGRPNTGVHSRAVRVFLIVLVGAVLAAGAAGTAGADHGDPVDETEIVEVQTISGEGTAPGEVTVSYSYHVGDDIAGLEVTLSEAVEPTDLDGFEATEDPRTYRWDEQTAEPTIETRYAVNRSSAEGPEAVDTGDWTMIASPNERSTRIGYTVQRGTEVTVDRVTTVAGEGYAGETMVYLGPHERRGTDDGTIDLVVSDFAAIDDREETLRTVEVALEQSTATLESGVDEQLTVYVVGAPLRSGGLAISSDVWVSDRTLPPELTVWHEFVHTQQRYDWAEGSEWTVEGGADYLAALLALEQGEIQYSEFQQRLARGGDYEDVTLADPDTWAGTRANYQLGALVLAALDRELRATGGTYEELLRAKNDHDGQVSGAAFETLAAEVAGTDLSGFVEEYVRSPPPEIAVPLPTVYDAGNDGARLTLQATDTTVGPDQVARIPVELTNEGSETSLAPTLSASGSDGSTALISNDNGTRASGHLVFDHLAPGESVQTTVLLEHAGENASLDVTVEDMSGVSDASDASVTVVEDNGGEPDDGTDDEAATDGTDESANSGVADDEPAASDDSAGPGFGVAAGGVALVGTALLARRRQPQEN